MAVNPYKVPIFSWVKTDPNFSPVSVKARGETDEWTMAVDPTRPLFPYLAFQLEEWLNNTVGGASYKCRWIFDTSVPWAGKTYSNGQEYNPKLAIITENIVEVVSIEFSNVDGVYTPLPHPHLDETYSTVGTNWPGISGDEQAFIGPTGRATAILDFAPWGVWNPGVLTYSDERVKENSVAQAVNPLASRHAIRRWGGRTIRTITMLYVPVSNVFAHRRIDPFYEQASVRRLDPNNLFESLFDNHQQDDNTLWIWTEVGDPAESDSALYAESFKGRLGKVLALSNITELTESITDATSDGKLVDIAVQVVEGGDLEQTIPAPCRLGA